MREKNIANFNH